MTSFVLRTVKPNKDKQSRLNDLKLLRGSRITSVLSFVGMGMIVRDKERKEDGEDIEKSAVEWLENVKKPAEEQKPVVDPDCSRNAVYRFHRTACEEIYGLPKLSIGESHRSFYMCVLHLRMSRKDQRITRYEETLSLLSSEVALKRA
eukprot:1506419-Amphidinium_carterae.3